MKIDFTLWPNPDGELGVNKVTIPTGIGDDTWPDGDALINNVVYKDGKISGFVDTKALTVNESATTTINYDYFDVEFSSIKEGDLTINRGPRSKYFNVKWGNALGEEIALIRFEDMDEDTKTLLRSATKVVDNTLYNENDDVIGTFDTRRLATGSNMLITYEINYETGELLNPDISNTTDGKTADSLFGNNSTSLSVFDSDLSSLTDGMAMFNGSPMISFNSNLNSLINGDMMFYGTENLTTFNVNMPSLTSALGMFMSSNITTFKSNMPSLKIGCFYLGFGMFNSCAQLSSFEGDMHNLINGDMMFQGCNKLSSFKSNLSSLLLGRHMFSNCELDTASVQNIAETINPNPPSSAEIHIDIGNSTPNEDENAAFRTMVDKGWIIRVNGSEYTPSAAAAVMTLDENGEEVSTPIPYYAKPVPATEKTASYVDTNGNFFNISGAQFIYGDDLSTYGMFTCEEDAATNMGLTKIEKEKQVPSLPALFNN